MNNRTRYTSRFKPIVCNSRRRRFSCIFFQLLCFNINFGQCMCSYHWLSAHSHTNGESILDFWNLFRVYNNIVRVHTIYYVVVCVCVPPNYVPCSSGKKKEQMLRKKGDQSISLTSSVPRSFFSFCFLANGKLNEQTTPDSESCCFFHFYFSAVFFLFMLSVLIIATQRHIFFRKTKFGSEL